MKTTLHLKYNDRGVVGDGSPVDRSGVVTPAGTYLVMRNEDLLLLYIPGHHYWSARGRQGYYGAEYEVWRVISGNIPKTVALLGDRSVWAERVLTIPVKRAKP